jgi:large subunit ribosomal protein L32
MPVPKRKRSKSRRDKRFANKGIKAKAFGLCQNCKATIQPHAICTECGFYKGRKVLTTKAERAMKRGELRKEHQAKLAARAPQDAQAPIDADTEK